MINKQNVTDWLNNTKNKKLDNERLSDPAILFTNLDNNTKFGNVFLFERFGSTKSNTYNITSQITSHYMEDNVSRQDHWSISPDTYVLSGLIGEIVYTPPKQWQNFVQKNVTDYLKPLSMLSPAFDSYTQSALNLVQAVETSVRRYEQIARNLYEDFTNTVVKSNQLKVAQIIKDLQVNRELVTIWTPYGTFSNMAILNAGFNQDESKYKSTLEIQLQKWRDISRAETREATDEEKRSYVAQVQKMREQDAGVAATQEVKSTTWSKIFGVGEVKR